MLEPSQAEPQVLRGDVHVVNTAAVAMVQAVKSAMAARDLVSIAEEAYRECARAVAEARDSGASIRALLLAVEAEARNSGITYDDARSVGWPFPRAAATVEGLAAAGRILGGLPGECPISCRALVSKTTRAYNTGQRDVLASALEEPSVEEAVERIEQALASHVEKQAAIRWKVETVQDALAMAAWALERVADAPDGLGPGDLPLVTRITALVMTIDASLED